jgi:replicative DNA helicase
MKQDFKKAAPKKAAQEKPNLTSPMPANIKAEETVLGAIIIDAAAYLTIQSSSFALNIADFHSQSHQHIWRAIEALGSENKPIDLITVCAKLTTLGLINDVGGAFYIVELTNRIASAANIEYHAQILKQYSIRRGVILNCYAAMAAAYDETEDAIETLGTAQQKLSEISNGFGQNKVNLSELSLELYRSATDNNFLEMPIPTGFYGLDLLLEGGIYPDDNITLLGGRPGSGKTAFALGLVLNKLRAGVPVVFFSYEMTAKTLLRRLWSIFTEIDHARIRKQQLTEYEKVQLSAAMIWFEERAHLLQIFDCTGMPLQILLAKITKAKMDGINEIYIDHFGEIPKPLGTNEEEYNELKIRSMRNTAKALDMRFTVLIQFRKLSNGATQTKPVLSDIKGSSAISECCSVALFLHEEQGIKTVIAEKARNAKTADIPMEYNGSCYQWESIEKSDEIGSYAQPKPDLQIQQNTFSIDYSNVESEWE